MKLIAKVPLLIGTVVLATAIMITLVVNNAVGKALRRTAFESLLSNANNNAELVKTRFDAQLNQLWEIANRTEVRNMDMDAIRDFLRPDISRIGALEIGLVSPNGIARYVNDPATPNLGDRDYIKAAFSGNTSVSDVIISRVTNTPVIMFAAPVLASSAPDAPAVGVLIARKDGAQLSDILDSVKTGYKTGYVFIVDNSGTIVAHPNREWVNTRFNPRKASEEDTAFKSLGNMIAAALEKKNGTAMFALNGKEQKSGFTPIPDYPWTFIMAMESAELEEEIVQMRAIILKAGLYCVINGVIIAIFLGLSIVRPIRKIAHALDDIAQGEGDLTKQLKVTSKNELSEMAGSYNKLTNTLRVSISETKSVVGSLAAAAEELSAVSGELSAASEEKVKLTTDVTDTAKRMAKNIDAMADGAQKAAGNASDVAREASAMSDNMCTIANAIKTMSASINQIASNAGDAHHIAKDANAKSSEATATMNKLGGTAKEIGDVTEVIKRIAKNTNLLALNATVEAARAGEAGKGFAVVAGEIKKLADQSAKSADNITKRIEGIQRETDAAVAVIDHVSDIIVKIDKSIEAIAEHVKKQTKTSDEIAGNVASANESAQRVAGAISKVAIGNEDIARNAAEAAAGATQVSQNIANVNTAAREANQGAAQVNSSANQLADMAEHLQAVMAKFKV